MCEPIACEKRLCRACNAETQQPIRQRARRVGIVVFLTWLLLASLVAAGRVVADENIETLKREIEAVKKRVTALEEENKKLKEQIDVDRLIVRKELIVSDTGQPWEKGFEAQQIPRGIYARSLWDGPGGLWVRSRLIKGEIDDPFDDRFHALEKDGSMRRSPGHISWNVWLDGAWRQMAIIQGEGLELSEVPLAGVDGRHSSRPHPLADLPAAPRRAADGRADRPGDDVAGRRRLRRRRIAVRRRGAPTLGRRNSTRRPCRFPTRRRVLEDDGSGEHHYAIIAVGPQGLGARRLTGSEGCGTRDASLGQR